MGKLDTLLQKVIRKNTSPSDVKSSQPSSTDIFEMVKNCRDEITKSNASDIMPSPEYFEQVAVLSRKEKRYENEIAICEMYIELAEQYTAEHGLSESEFYECVQPKCEPLYIRMNYARDKILKNAS